MWPITRLLALITRVFVIIITLLLCIVTLHVAASADGGPGTDWLTVSVSAAADPDLASRYSRAEVTEVTRIYKEDNTNTATARPLAHTAATLFLPHWHRVNRVFSSFNASLLRASKPRPVRANHHLLCDIYVVSDKKSPYLTSTFRSQRNNFYCLYFRFPVTLLS